MGPHACRLGDIDREQLAWAAGLFDGEGSAIASARADRPGYLRLEVTVPQCGHDAIPEVLMRFQATVLDMGTITGPDSDDMSVWRASGFQEANATIALLWSQLGPVKRAQAAAAMRAVAQQYASGASARASTASQEEPPMYCTGWSMSSVVASNVTVTPTISAG